MKRSSERCQTRGLPCASDVRLDARSPAFVPEHDLGDRRPPVEPSAAREARRRPLRDVPPVPALAADRRDQSRPRVVVHRHLVVINDVRLSAGKGVTNAA